MWKLNMWKVEVETLRDLRRENEAYWFLSTLSEIFILHKLPKLMGLWQGSEACFKLHVFGNTGNHGVYNIWISLRGFLFWWAHLAQYFKECSFQFIGLSPRVQLRKERSLPGCNWKGSLGQWPWAWRSLRGSQSRALWAPQRRAGRRGGRREERDQALCHWTDRGPLPSIPWWCQGLLLPLQPHLMRWGG